MSYEEINEMMMAMGLPFAYHHFSEGESPKPPFLIFLSPGENTFSADNIMYHSFKKLDIELYTDEKSPDTEAEIEAVLRHHHIFYNKSETWIASEEMYEVLYETEV
ncbi:MAG: hypothetical protein NC235_11910 [Clostridiales bacterium]|nr:hypothetical protein [Clostridiales bacterium]